MLGVIALGGGFNGVISVGYWKYLKEKRIIPDYIQLISVNVLNGLSYIAGKDISELEYWWLNIIARKGPSFIFQRGNVVDFLRRALFGSHLFDSKGLEFLVEKSGDVPGFFLSSIYTEIVTQNESTGKLYFFNNKDAKPLLMPEIILASTALIPAFSPRLIEGEYHSDALIFDVERAIRYGCDEIIIMRNDHNRKICSSKHWFNRLIYSQGKLINELTDEKIKLAKLRNPQCRIKELKIEESIPYLDTDYFQKNSDDMKKAIEYGYRAAERIIGK